MNNVDTIDFWGINARTKASRSYLDCLEKAIFSGKAEDTDVILQQWFNFLDSKCIRWDCIRIDYIAEYAYDSRISSDQFMVHGSKQFQRWKKDFNYEINQISDFYNYSINNKLINNDLTIRAIQYTSRKRNFV